jgi:hypothetical protein
MRMPVSNPHSLLFATLLAVTSAAGAWPYRPQADVSGRTVSVQATVTHLRPNHPSAEIKAVNGEVTIPDSCSAGERIVVTPRLDRVYDTLEASCRDGKFKVEKLTVRRGIAADRR